VAFFFGKPGIPADTAFGESHRREAKAVAQRYVIATGAGDRQVSYAVKPIEFAAGKSRTVCG
jgi:hypothetical protein